MGNYTEEQNVQDLLSTIQPANATWKAQRVIIHGLEGVGKTTFASTFKNPVLAPIEDGAGNVDIKSFPLIPHYGAMCNVINALHHETPYQTLVVDSLDWLERLVWAETCQRHGKKSIEDFGYGKGYVEAMNVWGELLGGFDSLRLQRGMDVVLIAHSDIKRFESPETEPYDRYQIKLHKAASALFEEWADVVLFVNYKIQITETDSGFNKTIKRGQSNGQRVIRTEERPAYKAKNRWSLPVSIDVLHIKDDPHKAWSNFHYAMNTASEGRYALPEKLQANEG